MVKNTRILCFTLVSKSGVEVLKNIRKSLKKKGMSIANALLMGKREKGAISNEEKQKSLTGRWFGVKQ